MAEPETKSVEAKKSSGFDFSKTLKESFDTIKSVFVKPATKENKKFADVKTAGIFAGFAAVIYLVVELISAIIQTVVTKSCENISFSTMSCSSYKTKVDFNNLNNCDFFKALGNDVLTLVGIVAVVAIVVYVMGLIFKKQPKFMKLVAITTAGLAPFFAASFISTIVAYIWTPLAVFVIFAGMVATFAYIINAVSKEIVLEGDKKIFFHIVSIVVMFIVAYFILTSIAKDSAAGAYIKLLGL